MPQGDARVGLLLVDLLDLLAELLALLMVLGQRRRERLGESDG